MIIYLREPYVN